MVCTYFLQEY